jgi:hypothetical protein
VSWRREVPGAVVGLLGCLVVVVVGTRTGLAQVTTSADANATSGSDRAVLRVQTDGTGQDLFPRLVPGQTVSRCTTVTYFGDAPGSLSASADQVSGTRGLDRLIGIRLEEGSAAAVAGCDQMSHTRVLFAGPMSTFPTVGRGTGAVDMTGSGRQATRFRITYSLPAGTPNSAQGGTATFRIRWSVQGS